MASARDNSNFSSRVPHWKVGEVARYLLVGGLAALQIVRSICADPLPFGEELVWFTTG